MKCKAVVIVLTLNEVKNIKNCISSIGSSDFSDVFVFDGGSTDGTLEVLNDMNIPYEIYNNTTISDRRSLGIQYAERNNYKFALFLDADQVIIEPDALSKSINYFQSNENLAAIQYNLITPLVSKNLNYWQQGFITDTQ